MNRPASRIETAGLSDSGRKRPHNEDAYVIDEALGLLLVADGMGGHEAGEVASRMAIDELSAFFKALAADPGSALPDLSADEGGDEDGTMTYAPATLAEVVPGAIGIAIKNTCRSINDINRSNSQRDGSGMGTTIVGLWLLEDEKKAVIFHVGDSRLYRLRGDKFYQITRDHTAYEQWLDEGGWGDPPKRNVITRALGPWPQTTANVRVEDLQDGDVFLLCSDGLSDMLGEKHMQRTLEGDGGLEAACAELVKMANDNGGKDNITVTLARYA